MSDPIHPCIEETNRGVHMKIIELRAENVKRLKAIEIHPADHMQVIGGRNAQGKSSVLDAIWLALGGGAAAKGTARPIRDGESKASVTLDLGDLTVTRSWTAKGTALKVTSADGATYSSPQGMLDALVGRLSFDPLEFTRLRPADQRRALLDIVDLPVDVDELDRERKARFDERADVGRRGRSLGDVAVDESLPTEETSAASIIAKIREAQAAQRKRDDAETALTRTADKVAELEAALKEWRSRLDYAQKALNGTPPAPDTAPMEADLATVEERNAAIRANNVARARAEEKATLRARYDSLTEDIASIDQTKADALAAAEFPVEGLAFDESGVLYGGVPFSQASSAEQIRVSLAMAMATSPKLRVIRILDGSLLDAENLTLIEGMARDNDYQVWIERVGNADEGAVVIEDGQVQ